MLFRFDRALKAAVVGVVVCSCGGTEIGSAGRAVVHGDDDRKDVYEHPDDRFRGIARRSVVALVSKGVAELDSWVPDPPLTIGDVLLLCDGEAFSNQPGWAYCSGVLVDYDLVITNRHCVPDQAACDQALFAFDYLYEADGVFPRFSHEALYECASVVAAGQGHEEFDDFTFLRLGRAVDEQREPASLWPSDGFVGAGELAGILGFPSGVPLKIDTGGHVLETPGRRELYSLSGDVFSGNSGSGVFDEDGQLFALVSQSHSEDYRSAGFCLRVNRVGEEDEPAFAVPINVALQALEATGWTARLPNRDSGCWSCRSSNDCESGHDCVADVLTNGAGWCAMPCANGGCGAPAICESGYCVRAAERVCRGNTVMERNGCGRPIRDVERCADGFYCREGACVPEPSGRSCLHPLERTGTFTIHQRAESGESLAAATCGGEEGLELIVKLTVESPSTVTVKVNGWRSLFHIRTQCEEPSSEIACVLSSGLPSFLDPFTEIELDPGEYYLFVDSHVVGDKVYRLEVNVMSGCGCSSTARQRHAPADVILGFLMLLRYARSRFR